MPTVSSEVELCNLALARIGNDRQLSSLTEANKPARLCSLHYPITRDAVLAAHPWNEAIRRVDLAAEVGEPPFEYTYRFPLPSDCLKVIRTEDESAGFEDDYRIEGVTGQAGRYLLSGNATVAIEYIARVTDVSLFGPLLADTIIQRLAAELAPAFAESLPMAEKLWQIYQAKLAEARSVDAQEGTPRDEIVDAWLNARL
jgi:hypothetical protein